MSNVQVSDSVLSNKMIVTVKAEKDPITEGGLPVIIGTVKDQGYKSVPNANVLIAFGSVIVTTTTDAQGNYRYQSATPFTQGVYEVDVTASKIGYVKGLASATFTVKPNVVASAVPKTLSGLPIQVGNYTVFLGKVAQWNLETTCFVNFADKHMRFLKTCDLFSWAPDDFKMDQPMMSMVSVLQYNDVYKLFPKQVYVTTAGMTNDTSLKKFVSDTWAR
jgi:hypothetical protein